MKWKNIFWKGLTIFIVTLIIFNPETLQLALFIDAVGLDLFLMLLEVQIFSLLGLFINTRIKPLYTYLINFYSQHFQLISWKSIKETPDILMLVVPGPAILMSMLVFSAAISIIFNR